MTKDPFQRYLDEAIGKAEELCASIGSEFSPHALTTWWALARWKDRIERDGPHEEDLTYVDGLEAVLKDVRRLIEHPRGDFVAGVTLEAPPHE